MNRWSPILIAAFAEVIYQIASKGVPPKLNAFASLTITYIVAGVISALMCVGTGGSLLRELRQANWAALLLGLAIVGLETGGIFMYRVGWRVNTGYVCKAIISAVSLIFVGRLLYREAFTLSKAVGVALCLGGLFLINR